MARRAGLSAHAFGADPIVVAYGMGVDSTAMLIGLRDNRVPVALILFADTGSEKPETMAYLPIIQTWLAMHRMPPVTVIKRHSPRAGDTSLHAECLRKRVLPSLAYGGHSCSLKWKVDPQWSYTRRYFGWSSRAQSWPHGPSITKLIGYDAGAGDARRISNAMGKWPPGHRYRYPLTEWGWTRERCEAVILGEGLPLPMKSACWMCPASKKPEVDWLAQTHPDLAETAMAMERLAHARGLTTTRGLGRRWSWSEYLGRAIRPSRCGERWDCRCRAGRRKGPARKACATARLRRLTPLPRPARSGRGNGSSEEKTQAGEWHMQELLTREQRERMLANGRREQTDEDFDPEPVVKLIVPGLAMVWLLTSLDPDSPQIAFGLCDLGFGTPELGHVSLDELAEAAGPAGPSVYRDPSFIARKPLSAYAATAAKAQAIVTD